MRPGVRYRGRTGWLAPVALVLAAMTLVPGPYGGSHTAVHPPPGPTPVRGGALPSWNAVDPPPTTAAARSPELSTGASVGQIGYTWDLANGSAYPRAVSPPLEWQPSALAYVSATDSLWVAWGPNPFGLAQSITVVNASSGLVARTLPGTSNCTAVLYDAARGTVFAAQALSPSLGQVLFLNATTGAALASPVRVGSDPQGMALDPYAGLLYVVSNGTGIASSIAVSTETVVDPFIAVGTSPDTVAYDAESGAIYVGNYGSDNVTVLNGSTGAPATPSLGLTGGIELNAIVDDPATGYVYFTYADQNYGSGDLGRFEIGAIDPAIEAVVGDYSPNSGTAASTTLDPTSGDLEIVTRSVVAAELLWTFDPVSGTFTQRAATIEAQPSVQAVDPRSGFDLIAHAFDLASPGPAYLSTVNLSTGSSGVNVLLGASARAGTYDPSDGQVFVADSFSTGQYYGSEPDSIAHFNATGGPVLGSVPIGYSGTGVSAADAPQAVGYDGADNGILVLDGGTTQVQVYNASTAAYESSFTDSALSDAFGLPNDTVGYGTEVLYAPAQQEIYLANAVGGIEGLYAGNLSMFFQSFGSIPPPGDVGFFQAFPYETVAMDSATGDLYVVDPGSSLLTDFEPHQSGFNASSGTVLGAGTGLGTAICFDPVDSDLYVADSRADLVYVINGSNFSAPSQIESIPVGVEPHYVAFDPSTDAVVVANYGSANLTILNGTTPAAGLAGATSLSVNPGPSSLIVDPAQRTILVDSSLVGTVQAITPVPSIYRFTGTPTSTDVGLPVQLGAVATGGVPPLHYQYSGLPTGCTSQDTPDLVCTPTGPGTFDVQLAVQGAGPTPALDNLTLRVLSDPAISETTTLRGVDVGLPIGFTAVVTNGTGPLQVHWTFGDGYTASGTLVQHVYGSAGRYEVTGTVIDALGANASVAVTIPVGGVLAASMANPSTTPAGQPVSVNATAVGGVGPYSFTWTFGDGSSVESGGGAATPNGAEVAHAYAAPGTYHLTVLVRDSGGELTLAQGNVTIGPPLPTPVSPGSPNHLHNTSASIGTSSSVIPPALLVADVLLAVAVVAVFGWWRPRRPPVA